MIYQIELRSSVSVVLDLVLIKNRQIYYGYVQAHAINLVQYHLISNIGHTFMQGETFAQRYKGTKVHYETMCG